MPADVSYSPLPIDPVLPEVAATLRQGPNLVLRAPTGAGKTTRVPPALLDAGLAGAGRILVLEPRRLAARAAARRMAAERRQRVGEEIGYHVRFDKQWGRGTRIIVLTPGVLLRLLQDDPFLEMASIVICDEFHERGLESDLALGMLRLIQQNVRQELRLVVMSATLEVEAVSQYLGGCPIIASEGKSYPVEIGYAPRRSDETWPAATARGVRELFTRTAGDILVFLPGWNEIRQSARELEALAEDHDLAVLPLHGDLPAAEQDAALLPQSRRKVVLSTNVAETSVTVEGITGVVDTGLARQLTYDPAVGLDRLELTPISQASAAQRAGRAGRTQPGACLRLWSEVSQRSRPLQTEPEIRRVDLAGAVLQLLAMGETDIRKFPWLEPPKDAVVDQAFALLARLGACANSSLTELGQTLARLPVHPRLGRLLIEGHRLGEPRRAALAAALLSERDPFLRRADAAPVTPTFSDLLDRVEAIEEFERSGRDSTSLGAINRGAAQFLLRARDQLLHLLQQETRNGPSPAADFGADACLRALLAAFPDRLARRREADAMRGVMVGGRGVRLSPASGVREAELFLCLDVDASQGESWVRLASGVRRDWLPAELVTVANEVEFDTASERLIARKRIRFDDLVLEESPAAVIDEEAAARLLAEAAAANLQRVLPPADSPAGLFRARVQFLAQWCPELKLPTFDDSMLLEILPELCFGRRSFADLRQADWLAAMQGRLTHAQRQTVEREAPERLEVPSGSRIALKYEPGRPPVLAVRIQELFGMKETPRIAGGRVRVLFHLLAPNFRPQQITDDLASFWANTYPQVRKELRARYPKHSWPEDPLSAAAERRPKRKS